MVAAMYCGYSGESLRRSRACLSSRGAAAADASVYTSAIAELIVVAVIVSSCDPRGEEMNGVSSRCDGQDRRPEHRPGALTGVPDRP